MFEGLAGLLWGASSSLFYIVLWVITGVAWWKLFEKAGKPGWAALIPIYNMVVLLDIVGLSAIWIIAFFIPAVNFIAFVYVCYRLAQVFGQQALFTLGLILLNPIFTLILGLGDAKYRGRPA